MARRMTDIEIAARIVPTMLRWPPESAFDPMRECVEALRDTLHVLDEKCDRAEQDPELKRESIGRRRTQLGEHALAQLLAFEPFLKAELAVNERIKHLDTKTQNSLAKALNELREGVAAAKRAVVERCQMSAHTFAPR
jgi:hypothetical protein